MPQPLIELVPGRLVAGRYRLLRPLGSGGSAYVWAARDEALGREVAVKALSGSTSQGGHERERLRREAQLLAALDDPHITTVYDYAETVEEDGTTHPVLVTELVDGTNLGARLESGPLEPHEAITVCAQVAKALAAAHRSGVVHRDVKPGNVMLTGGGAKLLDFGISRRASDTDLTGGVLLGTPACMAPERWRGRSAQPASDVYALGCLLYWCLSGRAPYGDRELTALGFAHLQDSPPPLPAPQHSPRVEEIYLACVRKDPAARPSAARVAELLDAADAGPAVLNAFEPDEGPATVAMRPLRGRGRLAAIIGSAVVALSAAIVLPLALSGAGGPSGSTAPATRATAPTTTATDTSGVSNASGSRPAHGDGAGDSGGGNGKGHNKSGGNGQGGGG